MNGIKSENKTIVIFIFSLLLILSYFKFYYVNYNRLEQALIQANWREADLVTTDLLLRISGRKIFGDIPFGSIENFSCKDIKEIDYLWGKYSTNKFGFSVQIRQWESMIASHKSENFSSNFNIFENQVGWDRAGLNTHDKMQGYDRLNFSLNAPNGELPSFHWLIASKPIDTAWNDSAYTFFNRIKECKIK